MKNKIKNWLGITSIENIVGKEKVTKTNASSILSRYLFPSFSVYDYPDTLVEKYERLKKDFEELDNKFDHLERYMQIEFIKKDIENQTYDWAGKKHEEGFRKCSKTYEQYRKSKVRNNDDE